MMEKVVMVDSRSFNKESKYIHGIVNVWLIREGLNIQNISKLKLLLYRTYILESINRLS